MADLTSVTPILDRLVPPPSLPVPVPAPTVRHKMPRALLWILIGLAVFALLVNAVVRLPAFPFGSWLQLVARVLQFILACFAAITVHELGHATVGKLTGFHFVMMRVGPLQVTPPLRVKWEYGNPLPGSSGFVWMVASRTSYLRTRAVFMLLGGPAANLVTSFACIAVIGPFEHYFFLGWFIVVSIYMGLANLVPFRRESLVSDGRRILTLVFRSRQGNRWLALMQLQADLRNGVAAEDLNVEFVKMATAIRDASTSTAWAHTIAYSRAFYRESADEAARLLEICLQYSNFAAPRVREAIFTNAATFQATRRKRIDLAREWMKDVPEKTMVPGRRLWIEAAILEGQGDLAGALRKLDEVEAETNSCAVPALREAGFKSLLRWRTSLQKEIDAKQKKEAEAALQHQL